MAYDEATSTLYVVDGREGYALVGVTMLLLLLMACNPVAQCDVEPPDGDCCETDEQCQAHFGNSQPFCFEPERQGGGWCSECLSGEDCPSGYACAHDSVSGGRSCYIREPGSTMRGADDE